MGSTPSIRPSSSATDSHAPPSIPSITSDRNSPAFETQLQSRLEHRLSTPSQRTLSSVSHRTESTPLPRTRSAPGDKPTESSSERKRDASEVRTDSASSKPGGRSERASGTETRRATSARSEPHRSQRSESTAVASASPQPDPDGSQKVEVERGSNEFADPSILPLGAAATSDALLALAAPITQPAFASSLVSLPSRHESGEGSSLDAVKAEGNAGEMQTLPEAASTSVDTATPALLPTTGGQNSQSLASSARSNAAMTTTSPQGSELNSQGSSQDVSIDPLKLRALLNAPTTSSLSFSQSALTANSSLQADLMQGAASALQVSDEPSGQPALDAQATDVPLISPARLSTVFGSAGPKSSDGTSAAEVGRMVSHQNLNLDSKSLAAPSGFQMSDASARESESEDRVMDAGSFPISAASIGSSSELHTANLPLQSQRMPEASTQAASVDAADGITAARSMDGVDVLRQEILSRVVDVRHQDSGSMSVVLRPDPSTELNVQLRRREGGGVEVVVRMDRGEVGAYQSSWASLQHSFSQHGVRLADLQVATSGANAESLKGARFTSDALTSAVALNHGLPALMGQGSASGSGADSQEGFHRGSRTDLGDTSFAGSSSSGQFGSQLRDRQSSGDAANAADLVDTRGVNPGGRKRESSDTTYTPRHTVNESIDSSRLETWA